MAKLWIKLRGLLIFWRVVRNPNRTDLIFSGIKNFSRLEKEPQIQHVVNRALAETQFKRLFDARYVPAKPDLRLLAEYPQGSFGRAIFEHMHKNQIDFTIFPFTDFKRPIEYISQRMYYDHDLYHVLLGYGTSIPEELGVQGFAAAQLHSPLAAFIITGGLLHLLFKNPLDVINALGLITRGYAIGQRAKFLLGQKLPDYFSRPLSEVRRELGLDGESPGFTRRLDIGSDLTFS